MEVWSAGLHTAKVSTSNSSLGRAQVMSPGPSTGGTPVPGTSLVHPSSPSPTSMAPGYEKGTVPSFSVATAGEQAIFAVAAMLRTLVSVAASLGFSSVRVHEGSVRSSAVPSKMSPWQSVVQSSGRP